MNEAFINEIVINGETYVKKSSIPPVYNKAPERNGMRYCLVRGNNSGVFAGYVEEHDGQCVIIRDVRRIWYWSGACSLSQLAKDGTADPKNCKFTVVVNKIEVLDAIEIIECTERAQKSITEVAEWKV